MTPDVVNKLIARLGKKLYDVETSTAPESDKIPVRDRIVPLMSDLHRVVPGGTENTDWVVSLAKQFKELASHFQKALGLAAARRGLFVSPSPLRHTSKRLSVLPPPLGCAPTPQIERRNHLYSNHR